MAYYRVMSAFFFNFMESLIHCELSIISKKYQYKFMGCEQHPNHPQPKSLSFQSAVGCGHQESVSTATNEHARIDCQPSPKSLSARNHPLSSSISHHQYINQYKVHVFTQTGEKQSSQTACSLIFNSSCLHSHPYHSVDHVISCSILFRFDWL